MAAYKDMSREELSALKHSGVKVLCAPKGEGLPELQ